MPPPTPATQIPTTSPYPWPHDFSLCPSTTALLIVDMQRDLLSSQGYLSTSGLLPPDSDTLARFQALVPRLVSLLSTFRHAGFGVWFTRLGRKGNGEGGGGGGGGWGREGWVWSRCSERIDNKHDDDERSGDMGNAGTGNGNGIDMRQEQARQRGGRGGGGMEQPFLVRGSRGHDITSELHPLPSETVIDRPCYGAFTYSELELTLRARGIRNLVVCGIALEGAVSSTVREAADRGFDVCVVEEGVEGWASGDEAKRCCLDGLTGGVGGMGAGGFGVRGSVREVVRGVESWMGVGEAENGRGR